MVISKKKSTKSDFLAAASRSISRLLSSSNQIFIAYSGGIDSHVLLDLLQKFCRERPQVKLTAIHVNHNLSPKAKAWVEHCRQVCKKLQVSFLSSKIAKVKASGHSPEEILRKLRYMVLAKALPKDACLVTAHHADDQSETLLLQMFRGAGPKGLAAMPEKVKFASGWLVRPLLNYSREEIEHYAHHAKLHWIEDESNTNTKFDRNLIRHQFLPLLKKKWPAIVTTLNRASRHCATASELLEVLAEKDWQKIACKSNENVLEVMALKKLSQLRQQNVLRFWFQKLGLPMPSEVKLAEVMRSVVNSRYDAVPVVRWTGGEIRRFRHGLYAMQPVTTGSKSKLSDNTQVLIAPIVAKLKLDPKKVKVRFRQGGEKVKLPGRQGTHTLKKLLQEKNVPPWLRDKVPLVYYKKKIVAVAIADCFMI